MKNRNGCRNGLFLLLILILVIVGGVSAGAVLRVTPAQEYPLLLNATIESLSEGLISKKFTSVDLVKAYLARIAEVNEQFHAVTEINPDALRIASALDLECSAGSRRGPLHGIPLLLKNNIATMDEMNNTAGSYALLGAQVPRDSTVAEKLRHAGAILLGKTSLSEWAGWRSLNSSNGWSPLGGQVYGPYFPHEDPWGSSSGSAVASALGLALGCLGTETDGSLTGPASFNNIVGIKPTVGLTSRHLVIPVSEHQDSVGILARTVKDAAQILQVIAGVDLHDNYTSAIPDGIVPDYLAACKHSSLSGARLGVPRNVLALHTDKSYEPMMAAFEQALVVLQKAGAIIVENTNFTAAAEFFNSTVPSEILTADFTVDLQKYLELLTFNPNNITSLDDLRDFTQSFYLEDFPTRDTGRWDQSLKNWDNTDPRFWPLYQQNLYYGGEGGLLGAIRRHNLDAILLPADWASSWAATVGAPIVIVPMGSWPADTPIMKTSWGLVESAPNIPFGIAFLGARFTEARLIGMAYAYEQRTNFREKVQPYTVPHVELVDVVTK